MNELLQKLLEAEVLSADTKTELEEAFKAQIDEAVESAKKEEAATVRAELTEQWITERDTLVEAVDTKVAEFLTTEMKELREDVESFRDLEAEYAEKIVEERAALREELKVDLADLVEKLDSWLEIKLNSELVELREDLEQQKKNDFGRRIMEAFADEFANNFVDEGSVAENLHETQARLADTQEALKEAEDRIAAIERSAKMKAVLNPLHGKQREVMEAILKNLPTNMLEEGYKTFIGRVIKESDDSAGKGNDKVLTEKADESLKNGKVVTGDNEELKEAADKENSGGLSEEAKLRLKRLSGMI